MDNLEVLINAILSSLEKIGAEMKMPLEDIKLFSRQEFGHLRIPLEDIKLATNNFSPENVISVDSYETVYKGEMIRGGKPLTVRVKMRSFTYIANGGFLLLARYENPNVMSLLGLCSEGDKIILVLEYPAYGSLQNYLDNTILTWKDRLNICIGAARGIRYIHDACNTYGVRELCNFTSSSIFLDTNWEAKVSHIDDYHSYIYETDSVYSDPEYKETHRLSRSSDIYSLGIVLFEVLCGRLAYDTEYESDSQYLMKLVEQSYKEGKLDEIIDPFLKNQMAPDSLRTFSNIAYQCCNNSPMERPSMDHILQELEQALKHVDDTWPTKLRSFLFTGTGLPNLRREPGVKGIPMVQDEYYKEKNLEHWIIPLKEIYSATNGFCKNHRIGGGGFGGVYKGKLFHFDVRKYVRINGSQNFSTGGGGFGGYPRRRSTVAIKKLDVRYGQGKREFLQEIEVLSRLKHQNLVSLLGFCDHDGDMILVYEHASNGSLDKCIDNERRVYSHTWAQRLQICLDVAHGLSYLHNLGIIHRYIKSANILLGRNLEGVIGDFGLSRTSKHQNVEFSRTNVAGTPAYIDPNYFRTGELTKQSDIYSFGVVLWEVLCGRLAKLPTTGDDQEYLLHLARRHFDKNELNLIIDPQLREEFDKSSSNPGNKNFEDSIKTFAAIAYDCLDAKAKQLTMDDVVKELKKAWTFHVTGVEMFSLNTINSATSGFSEEHVIGKGTLGKVYTGTLSVSMQPKVVAIKRLEMVGSYEEGGFFKDVAMMSSYIHDNIIPFHGFCEEANEMILVFEHATNRSLDKHLDNSTLTWRHRLKISIGVAHGLQYIHSCVQPRKAVHGDIKSSHILLDDFWNATISDLIISKCEGTLGYRDPEYLKTGVLTKESDVYAFGVVLFELLSGRPAIEDRKVEAVIFHGIKEKADPSSIDIFSAIAYQCLQQNKEKRPTMVRVIKELQKAFNSHDEWEWEQKLPRDYKIILQMSKHPVPFSTTKKDLHCLLSSGILLSKVTGVEMFSLNIIESATNGFSEEHVIGKGTLGKVYKGTLSISMQPEVDVAIKRLKMVGLYEEGGFFKDVAMMSSYIHDNIIPFHGFCEEANEMILVFEHATNRSLDKHLDNSTLTWRHRIKISIGVAHGLQYIHSCVQPRKAVHGDIKSSHILLDDVWNATISDLIISKCEGTLGYHDPEYLKTGVLTKESDVYAFGVVLFELLSGKPAIEYAESDRQLKMLHPETSEERKDKDEKVVFLAQLAARCFEDRKLEAIIFHGIKEQADPNSIAIFSTIAYQCLQENKKKRPTMARVIKELQKAFNSHDEWGWEQKYNTTTTTTTTTTTSTTYPIPLGQGMREVECRQIQPLSQDKPGSKETASRNNSGKLSTENVWFSISMNGLKCEMVPATKFSYGNASCLKWASIQKSRFPKVAKILDVLNLNIQIKIRPQFLTLEKTYGAYLVFTFCYPRKISSMPLYINLKYKKEGETLNTYFAQWKTENKWLMVELFRFVNKDQTTYFEVLLESFSRYYCGSLAIFVEGIEFRPVTVDALVNKEIKDEKDVQGVYKSESDMHLGEKSGNDYHEVINRSQSNPVNTSEEGLNALLSKGILIDQGEKLFSVSKVSMKKCYMLSAKSVIYSSPNVKCSIRVPRSQSRCRFAEVVEILSHYEFHIKCSIERDLLSPNTNYGCFLVFQISEEYRGLKGPVKGRNLLPHKNKETNIISFRTPSQVNLQYFKWIPAEREDGWMEVIVWEIHSENEQIAEHIPMDMKLTNFEGSMSGLIVCGIEFRPI